MEILRCPVTGSRLHLEGTMVREDRLVSGHLVASDGHRYPIEDGIPNLVVGLDYAKERTAEQFAYEFTEVASVADAMRR